MSFCRNNNTSKYASSIAMRAAGRFCAVLVLFISFALSVRGQVHIPSNTVGSFEHSDDSVATPALPNEYASRYKEAPNDPTINIAWYAKPQEVASRIPLGELKVYVRRFEDDTPYLEKTVNKEKGRIFLKETQGLLYRIYDVIFVPYIRLEKYKEPTEGADAPLKFLSDNETDEMEGDSQHEGDAPNAVQAQEREPEQEVKTRVPTYEERNTGKSLFVEIQKLRKDGAVDSLVRYEGEALFFSETYRYTTKGALRTLNRKYSDGALFRLVYYFTGGGLEEEFHQSADKSVYYKKYTPRGDLKESARYNSDGALEYKILYRFAKSGEIESEEEIRPQLRMYTSYKDGKKHESVRYKKTTADDSKDTETVVSRVRYDYSTTTNTTFNRNAEFLHEKNSESFFDNEGTLIKKREYVDFELTKEIQYQKDDVRIETHFVKGKPVFRIRYEGARKDSEEILH